MALLEPSIPGSYTLAMATDAEFERAGSFDEALDVLLGRVEALGFDGVDSAYLPSTHAPNGGWVGPHISGRNFPTGWQKGWARYSRQYPYYRSAWGSDLPVEWDDVKAAAWLTPVQKDSIAYIGDLMGFADGITVPVHLAGGRFAFVTAAIRRRSDWCNDRAATEHSLLVLARSFHAAVARRFLSMI